MNGYQDGEVAFSLADQNEEKEAQAQNSEEGK
jgi:hypothetical protein